MEQIVANSSGKVRRERLNGKDYLVAPLTLIVHGVLNGSQGALYYPHEEIAKSCDTWNHTPIVVYHPVINGQEVSARDPSVLEKSGIGFVFRSQIKNANGSSRLTAEGWFDVEAVKRIDNRVLRALEAGKVMELSTGLFVDSEKAPDGATYNGKTYTFVARNYRPDHLAILPDQVGACSIKDGCGVLANRLGGVTETRSVGEYFMVLLHSATTAHLLHLQTRSYAAHMALDELYKGLPGLVDDLIESYQGKNEVVTSYPSGFSPPSISPTDFVKTLLKYVEEERSVVGSDSELQNITDEIVALLDSVLYKLRFLS